MTRYIPVWHGFELLDFVRRPPAPCFPFDAPRVTGFYVARNAIYHLFRLLGYADGKTVLMPAYHSGNEVAAVRATGANVRFYSVDRRFGIDIDEIQRMIREGAKALYVIHYLGWAQPVEELLRICREKDVLLVEDCALSLYAEHAGRALGTFGDFSIFCLYKTLPVPSGGLLIDNTVGLPGIRDIAFRSVGRLSTVARTVDLALERVRLRSNLVGGALMGLKRGVGHVLNAMRVERVPVGDMAFDKSRADLGLPTFVRRFAERFDGREIRRRRRENFRLLRDLLDGKAPLLDLDLEDGTCPLFFPILVPDKEAAQRQLLRHGICSMQFWNDGDPGASPGEFPDADFMRRHVLELPIHQDLGSEQIEYMARHVAAIGFRLETARAG